MINKETEDLTPLKLFQKRVEKKVAFLRGYLTLPDEQIAEIITQHPTIQQEEAAIRLEMAKAEDAARLEAARVKDATRLKTARQEFHIQNQQIGIFLRQVNDALTRLEVDGPNLTPAQKGWLTRRIRPIEAQIKADAERTSELINKLPSPPDFHLIPTPKSEKPEDTDDSPWGKSPW